MQREKGREERMGIGLVYRYIDDYLTRLQAILLLRKLNKFGLVEGFKRTQSHFGKSTIKFVE